MKKRSAIKWPPKPRPKGVHAKCNREAWVRRGRYWKCGWCDHRTDRQKAAQRRAEKDAWGGMWNS